MRGNLEKNILAAVVYSDIFDYPLTLKQIRQFLFGQKAGIPEIKSVLRKLVESEKIGQKGQFYFLPGREKNVSKRKEREKNSREKLKIAYQAGKILRLIPTVKFIGLSGALACRNSDKDDDIDLFIITQSGQLWTTRFLATLLLDLLGKRRKPKDQNVENKICLNLFLGEDDLSLGPRDLFLAREIVQLEPLYDKDFCYMRFLAQNCWIWQFFPNWQPKNSNRLAKNRTLPAHLGSKSPPFFVFRWLETVLYNLQFFYMRKRITAEKISKTRIFFHPVDMRPKILAEYQKRIGQLPS